MKPGCDSTGQFNSLVYTLEEAWKTIQIHAFQYWDDLDAIEKELAKLRGTDDIEESHRLMSQYKDWKAKGSTRVESDIKSHRDVRAAMEAKIAELEAMVL